MFGLGMWEILVILAVVLIFIGPKKLPEIAKTLGKGLREFRGATDDLRSELSGHEKPEDYSRRLAREQREKEAAESMPAKYEKISDDKAEPDKSADKSSKPEEQESLEPDPEKKD